MLSLFSLSLYARWFLLSKVSLSLFINIFVYLFASNPNTHIRAHTKKKTCLDMHVV